MTTIEIVVVVILFTLTLALPVVNFLARVFWDD